MKLVAIVLLAAVGALLVGPAGLADLSVVWDLRLPRVVAALAAGAALGAGGVGMQTVLRNPLADPYILGMAGGASLGAVLAAVGALAVPPAIAGAAGAWLAATAVGALAGAAAEGERLLLVGVAVSLFTGALTTVVLQVAPEGADVRAALYWLGGGLGGARLPAAVFTLGVVGLVGGFGRAYGRDLDALLLGEDTAATLGVSVVGLRHGTIVAAAALTGLVVALGGAIGFCGLVAPHLARRLYGATHRRLLPAAMGIGAVLVLVADTAARTVAAPRELPVGALTALVGAPWLLTLLRRGTAC